jgi:hypothetical protein
MRLNYTQLKLTAIKECFSECDVLTWRALVVYINLRIFFLFTFRAAKLPGGLVASHVTITSRRIE